MISVIVPTYNVENTYQHVLKVLLTRHIKILKFY